MLTPELTMAVMTCLIIFMLVIIPILDSHKTFGKFVSLRYTLVGIWTITAVGCVLDFAHLADGAREIVLLGGLILAGLFIVARTFEKHKLGSRVEFKASKGDLSTKLTVDPKTTNDNTKKEK